MIKIFEMFAGYGGASFALKKAGIPFECVGFSEIDKYAIQCYQQNHNLGSKPLDKGNCLNINPYELPDFDLLTGGFPCQAFSVAGKGLGELDPRGTLFNEIIRIAEIKKPKYMLLENVKGLTTKRNKETFNKIIQELSRIGYSVNVKILNSKEYGIPQNRERVFFVCFRENNNFKWPKKEKIKIFVKDILEDEVEEKYFLKKETILNYLSKTYSFHTRRFQGTIANTLLARNYKDPKLVVVDVSQIRIEGKPRYYFDIHPTLNTSQGGGHTPFIDDFVRIRKVTPREYFRLMGFLNDEINLNGLSDTQKYKLAGNGWDINLVSKIFKQMFSSP